MMHRWVMAALLVVAACDKKSGDASGNMYAQGFGVAPTQPETAGSGAGSATVAATPTETAPAVAVDPWGGPPPGADAHYCASIGDDLKKVEETVKVDPWAMETKPLADRAPEIAKIEQPVQTSELELKTIGDVKPTNGYTVTYNPAKVASHEHYRTLFAKQRLFEQIAEGLNKTLRLPTAVNIQTVSCGTVNAFYDPNNQRIIVCYELFDYFLEMFKDHTKTQEELGNAVLGAATFAFFHEAGHSLIHVLDLPAVGREEDSVDQLATLTLIGTGDAGVSMALAGAYWFQLQSKNERKTPFWDEHAFDGQRFYNIVCLIYGSNPQKYGGFVTSGTLPRDRAVRCPEEYKKINKAWEKLLQPHFTNAAAENVAYTPSVPKAEAPTTTSTDPWATSTTEGAPAAPTIVPPPAPKAPASAITCEQIASHVAQLIGVEAEARAKKMSAAEIEQLKARLEAQLPSVLEQVIAECAKEAWNDQIRSCLIDAKSIEAAEKCGA